MTKGDRRGSIGGLFFSIPDQKYYSFISLDFEKGLSPSNSGTLNLGLRLGLPYENEAGVRSATGINIYLGGKYYFAPGSRLRPYGHVGLNYLGAFNDTRLVGGSLISYGAGLFYQSRHQLFGFVQFNNFVGNGLAESLDFQFGVGMPF